MSDVSMVRIEYGKGGAWVRRVDFGSVCGRRAVWGGMFENLWKRFGGEHV